MTTVSASLSWWSWRGPRRPHPPARRSSPSARRQQVGAQGPDSVRQPAERCLSESSPPQVRGVLSGQSGETGHARSHLIWSKARLSHSIWSSLATFSPSGPHLVVRAGCMHGVPTPGRRHGARHLVHLPPDQPAPRARPVAGRRSRAARHGPRDRRRRAALAPGPARSRQARTAVAAARRVLVARRRPRPQGCAGADAGRHRPALDRDPAGRRHRQADQRLHRPPAVAARRRRHARAAPGARRRRRPPLGPDQADPGPGRAPVPGARRQPGSRTHRGAQ
jgi:hypothetical protein